MGIQIAPADLTWLLMDRANNLMHIHGLMEFEELPDIEEVRQATLDRIVSKYRVLSQIPVHHDGHWYWEDHKDFAIENQVHRVFLPDGDKETMREFISKRFSEPFDRNYPLWDITVLSGPEQPGQPGAFFFRWHHGVADGVRLIQLQLDLLDHDRTAVPHAVGRGHSSLFERVLHVAEHTVKDTVDYVTHAGEVVGKAGRSAVATLNPLDLPHNLEVVADLARHPIKLVDALTSVAGEENETSNSLREVTRLLLHEQADTGAWSGHVSGVKNVYWLTGIDLKAVKRAAKGYGATVNDMMMAGVSLALTGYLHERGVTQVHDLAWMMPVSLKPVDPSMPPDLGNPFSVVLYDMPMGIEEPAELLHEVHTRATRLKNSVEPVLAFGMQRLVAESPTPIARRITDYFAGKTIGQITNVPGPAAQMYFLGRKLTGFLGWVPTSGDQPIGVCILSYHGTITLGLSTDTRMVPDAKHIAELIRDHVEQLVVAAPAPPTS